MKLRRTTSHFSSQDLVNSINHYKIGTTRTVYYCIEARCIYPKAQMTIYEDESFKYIMTYPRPVTPVDGRHTNWFPATIGGQA